MFDDVLIESAGRDKTKGTRVTALISAVVHILILAAVIAAGYYVKKNPQIIEKPIQAFVVAAGPTPPPPPPTPAIRRRSLDAESHAESRDTERAAGVSSAD